MVGAKIEWKQIKFKNVDPEMHGVLIVEELSFINKNQRTFFVPIQLQFL